MHIFPHSLLIWVPHMSEIIWCCFSLTYFKILFLLKEQKNINWLRYSLSFFISGVWIFNVYGFHTLSSSAPSRILVGHYFLKQCSITTSEIFLPATDSNFCKTGCKCADYQNFNSPVSWWAALMRHFTFLKLKSEKHWSELVE